MDYWRDPHRRGFHKTNNAAAKLLSFFVLFWESMTANYHAGSDPEGTEFEPVYA
jgi:hypothetical protein